MGEEIDKNILSLYKDFESNIKVKDVDLNNIYRAFLYAYEKHKTQKRASGENYIIHPIAVAKIVSMLYLDEQSIIAALLHDVIEDTDASKNEIEEKFGSDVLFLVLSLTKIGKIKYKSKEETQADNFRKMIIAMAKDIRVILIKLADRLHNMRTMCYLNREKQIRIARETLDVYVPIAHRLGIYWIKSELEDLSFKYLYPEDYKNLEKRVEESLKQKQGVIRFIEFQIRDDMQEAGISCRVNGRVKSLYSIYTKIKRKKIDFDGIYDLIALRIITKTESGCYAALGVIHSKYKPLPGRFKDYIALPKQNLYQSLHTTVFGPGDTIVEIQIRTEKMHEIAESGIAAHYRYKEGTKFDKNDKYFLWLRRLLKWQGELHNSKEFLNTMKYDLFMHEVYAFTPAGDLKVLPRGSTPVDFAYSVHTEIGNTCVGAKVNGKMVPLKYKLNSGDIVEIHTQQHHMPSRDWLNFVATSKARSKIRQKVSENEKREAARIGKDLLAKELSKINIGIQEFIKEKNIDSIYSYFGANSIDELFSRIGFGKTSAQSVVYRTYSIKPKKQIKSTGAKITYKVNVDGVGNVMMKLAKCCKPVYGDDIIGYITRGRGVVIHRSDCKNIKRIGYDCERLIDVEWDESGKKMPITLKVIVLNKIGILANVTNIISKHNIDTKDFKMKYIDGKDEKALFTFYLEVNKKNDINDLVKDLKESENIIDAQSTKILK